MAEVKTTTHEEASRLPEPKWFWRRVLIFIVTFWAMGLLTWAVWRVIGIANRSVHADELPVLGAIVIVIKYGFYTAWGALVLYGVGASVTDVATLASAVRTTRRETITTASPLQAIHTPEATVSPPVAPPEGLGGPRP